ncbi:FecR domain-containing protein [Planctomicrobium sp. SH661]|uniref:FecR domain-containing protein n=1 Tax=Planctomicrobium sp. SH661 TaxID=3448124 RepID=UPI003F5C0881
MAAEGSTVDEVRQLTDQLYDGEIDPAGVARIEELIMQDQQCLQTYVERLDFHSELLEQADQKTNEMGALQIIQQCSVSRDRQERRQRWKINAVLVACSLLGLAALGGAYYSAILVPAAVGTVASLSTDLELKDSSLELGQIVRRGQTISVNRGIVSLQLAHVTVDLIGPASLRLDGKSRVSLAKGTLLSKVQPEGVGFTVKTPDSEIVDLGTEFLVQHDTGNGTHLSVRRGAAQGKLLDWRGLPTKVMELTASRAAQFQKEKEAVKEVRYAPERFTPVDESRGGIRQLSGALRTVTQAPVSLRSNRTTTPNHLLVMPEKRVKLTSDLTVEGLSGPVTIPAGSTVASYLIHYDPTAVVSFAPRGAVTFFQDIAAIVVSSTGLTATDSLFGLPRTKYEVAEFRELELEEDEIQVSDDRKTVSFYFGVSPPEFLDEVRILVVESSP